MTKTIGKSQVVVQTWQTHSVTETLRCGTWIGRDLKPGMCVGLVGELGSGKTVLVKGIGRGLGIEAGNDIRSPSFVLLQMYQGPIPLNHFDFYRLDVTSDLEQIGVYEFLFDPNAVSVVEWADRVPEVLKRVDLRMDLSIAGKTSRTIRVQVSPPKEGY